MPSQDPSQNLQAQSSTPADRSADYNYQNARLVYENSDIAKFEYLQDGNEYGIRLNGIQQFISAENSNLDELEANTGISKDNLKIIPILFNSLHLSDFVSFTPDEIQVITSTYSTLLEQNTEKSNYTKLGNQSVVVNGKTYKLNNQNKFNFRNNEVNVAFWLINTIGGKVELRFEIGEERNIISADYNFLSEPLDLKEIKRGASKYSFGHNVIKQAKSFIMDVTNNNNNMTDELINANLENAFNYKQDLNYIIVKRDNDLLGIYKRK